MKTTFKKLFSLALCVVILSSALMVIAEETVTLYAEDGRSKAFPASQVEAQLTVGWYKEPVQRLYAEGKSKVYPKSQVEAQLTVGWYKTPVQRLYKENESKLFPINEVDFVIKYGGWSKEPFQKLYAEGKSKYFKKSEVAAQLAVGWYTEPVKRLYAPGKSKLFPESQVAAQLTVGWTDVQPWQFLKVAGKDYWIGMAESALGKPDETLSSIHGLKWLVFGTTTYDNFFAAEIKNGKVVTLISAGPAWNYRGYKAGDKIDVDNATTRRLYTDKNDNNKLTTVKNQQTLAGESKLQFHLTNAFRRIYAPDKLLKWSDKAATSAKLHSQDMADKNYFNHTALDGSKPKKRMSAQGIKSQITGENISGGYEDAFAATNGWINSKGHRSNMLGGYNRLGVGIATNSKSKYGIYYTQNFYLEY